jgi:ribosome-associated toxin RatA of RatAB toxin-antitoxin module
MKKVLLTIALFITGFSFAQTYNRISLDKLTITITNLEIISDFNSYPSKFNWTANLTVNGFEILSSDNNFQAIANQMNDDNKIIINQFKAKVSMKDKELKITNAKFSSPFLKADIRADLFIDKNNPKNTWLKSSTIKLDDLSIVLERFVFDIEKKLGQALPRKGKSIVIEASGPLGDLNIKGMDMEKLKAQKD